MLPTLLTVKWVKAPYTDCRDGYLSVSRVRNPATAVRGVTFPFSKGTYFQICSGVRTVGCRENVDGFSKNMLL